MDDNNSEFMYVGDILFQNFIGKECVLNFMKGFSLIGVRQILEEKNPSQEKLNIAEDIMNNIIIGYANEKHSVC